MPNVGKSTLYNALSNCCIHLENFPFCTIDPNSTRVHVPDERFDWLVDHHKPQVVVQPFLEIVDIAGLVKGASAGAGLGNALSPTSRLLTASFRDALLRRSGRDSRRGSRRSCGGHRDHHLQAAREGPGVHEQPQG